MPTFLGEILVGIIDAIGIWLAFLVYKNNPKGKINQTFVLMAILMFFWVTCAAGARILASYGISLEHVLTVLKIAWFTTPLLFFALYLFSIYSVDAHSRLIKINFFLAIIGSLAVLTNFILKDIIYQNGTIFFVYGKGIIPFLILIAYFVFITLRLLFKKYPTIIDPEEKLRLRFYLIGIFIFYLANVIFNITLPMLFNISAWYWIGDYSLIFLLGFLAYTIIRYKFLEIKVVLIQSLVAGISILLLVDLINSKELWKLITLTSFSIAGYLLIKAVDKEMSLRANLAVANNALSESNKTLDEKVKKRTAELQKAYDDVSERKEELEKFYKLTVGRELKMRELKKEIKNLKE